MFFLCFGMASGLDAAGYIFVGLNIFAGIGGCQSGPSPFVDFCRLIAYDGEIDILVARCSAASDSFWNLDASVLCSFAKFSSKKKCLQTHKKTFYYLPEQSGKYHESSFTCNVLIPHIFGRMACFDTISKWRRACLKQISKRKSEIIFIFFLF